MREIRERAYDILHEIDSYVKTYAGVLDKPRHKYIRDMTLGTIRSKSLILSQIAQKIRGITDRCKNSHQTEKRLSYNLNSPEWTIQEMRDIQDGKAIVNEKIGKNQLRYSSSVPVKRRKRGGRTHWKLRYDYFPVTLPGRDGDQLYLIVGYREGKAKPIYLLVSVLISSPRDALKWLKGYFKRWGIEDILRFWKQRFGLEDIRTTDIDNSKKLLWIAVVAFAFMTVYLLTDLKLRRQMIALTHRPRLAKQVAFLYYRIQKGVGKLFEVFSPILMKDIMSN